VTKKWKKRYLRCLSLIIIFFWGRKEACELLG
jgi:hypothetical protein